MHSKPWTEQEIEVLLKMVASKIDCQIIADRLGRSYQAVSRKKMRLLANHRKDSGGDQAVDGRFLRRIPVGLEMTREESLQMGSLLPLPPFHPITALTILSTVIRTDAEGRYCLNDCHKASGADKSKQPYNFLRLDTTRALSAEIRHSSDLRSEPIHTSNGGKNPGTYAVKELIYAYAMWINPSFHLTVIRAFDAMATGQLAPAASTFAIPQTLSEALRLAADQAEELAQLKPKAEALATISAAPTDLGVRDAGRELGIGQVRLVGILLRRKWACRDQKMRLRPAHYGLRLGYTRLVVNPYTHPKTGETVLGDDIRVTRHGMTRLAEMLAKGELQ